MGNVKDIVFRIGPTNTDYLKTKIRAAFSANPGKTLRGVVSNFDHRLSLYIAASGRIIENHVSK